VTARAPAAALLTALLAAVGAGCGGGGCGAEGDGSAIGGGRPRGGEPTLVTPDREGFEHDLFVVTGGGAGESFRLRFGPTRPPMRLAASLPTFYDGASLMCFGRLALRRSLELPGGGTFDETRIRLWEEDGLGDGRWIHEHGLYRDLDDDFGALCDPEAEVCAWDEAGGMDLVSIVGGLRGVRRWSGGYTGGAHPWAETRFVTRDRFGHDQEFLRLWGPEHRELIARAREVWDALPEEERSCYSFDYRSSYIRPAPGGLVWVMHGTPAYETCRGTVLPIEVPTGPPVHGGIDPSVYGEPGDVFHFGPPDLWFEPGATAVARTGEHRVELPGGDPEDPPVVAIHWMPEADIAEAHREAVDQAYTEVHDLTVQAGDAPEIDGRLDDWEGRTLLRLDTRSNLGWVRADSGWNGPGDAALAVGVREAEGGWVVGVRVDDDLWAGPAEGRRAVATDHLEIWLRGHDGWTQLAVLPAEAGGDAGVEAWSRAASGEQGHPLEPALATRAAEGVRAATTPRGGERYAGLDAEVFLPADLARVEAGRVGLRVLFADADGEHELQGDLQVGNTAPLADAWLHTGESR